MGAKLGVEAINIGYPIAGVAEKGLDAPVADLDFSTVTWSHMEALSFCKFAFSFWSAASRSFSCRSSVWY